MIKIYYKFIGFVGELHITPTKRWTALKPKNCTVCGVEYFPRSAISKYCPECREKIRKAQGTETKRRSRERSRQVCIELSAKNDGLRMASVSNDKIVRNYEAAIAYISAHEEISNVLISGGDSFMLPNDIIERYLKGFTQMSHLDLIRFGTRIPVVRPEKILQSDSSFCPNGDCGKKSDRTIERSKR